MQRTLGNRAVSQLVQARRRENAPAIQTKLRVGPKDDAYEQEADQVANRVMGMSQDSVMKGANDGQTSLLRKENGIQTAPANGVRQSEGIVIGQGGVATGPDVEGRLAAQKGGGQALDKETRAFMEPRFVHDLREVRVHADGEADSLNRPQDAEAFTTGKDVYFRKGAYDPGSTEGKRLIAHELTHVVQQGGGGPAHIQRAGKGDKFVMDIKIGSHTKSMEQFRLEGANRWLRFRKISSTVSKTKCPAG
jgi:hypothetical protein